MHTLAFAGLTRFHLGIFQGGPNAAGARTIGPRSRDFRRLAGDWETFVRRPEVGVRMRRKSLQGKDPSRRTFVTETKFCKPLILIMVGTGRFELPTPRTPSECSTRLSHVPTQRSRFTWANRL